MSKEFIPYEQALELKELGFDDYCYGFYGHNNLLYRYGNANDNVKYDKTYILAPLYQQAFRWFRDNHKLVGFVEVGIEKGYYTYQVYNNNGNMQLGTTTLHFNYTYEEAELACLNKLIEIVKNK